MTRGDRGGMSELTNNEETACSGWREQIHNEGETFEELKENHMNVYNELSGDPIPCALKVTGQTRIKSQISSVWQNLITLLYFLPHEYHRVPGIY